ncbi:MAG: ketosteroid isomerase [Moorea sp. SIO2B7]|nr:ketosteroid isomerase [Moorena sp. SIO2B7]
MSSEIIKNLIDAYFANMAAMNSAGWLDIFAEDAVIYDPVGSPPKKPYEDAQQFFDLLSRFYEKMDLSQDHIFIAGNGAAVKWTMRVVAKNGKNASTEGISVFEMNDANKIQQVSSYWDESSIISQLKD